MAFWRAVISLLIVVCLAVVSEATLIRQFIRNAAAKDAICNDGSDAGYYLYRNTSSTKWIVHLQGGGFCYTAQDCDRRVNTSFGSSRNWACALPHQLTEGDEDAAATVSSDSRRNPYFRFWNRVYVPYCSSDLWLGQNPNATTNPAGVSMAGHYIIVAVVNELLEVQGMNMATEAMFGGSSAGAIGTLMHLEDAASTIRNATRLATGQAAFVAGYSDGWTPFYPSLQEFVANPDVTTEQSLLTAGLVQAARFVFRGYRPTSCTDVYATSAAPFYGYQCADARWGARTVTQTPLIVLAARWDTHAIYTSVGSERYTCASTNLTLTTTEVAFVQKLGNYTYRHAVDNISSSASIFFTNCYTHTFMGVEDLCSGVNGTSAYNALAMFTGGAQQNEKVTLISPPPPSSQALVCNSDCGGRQCAWGSTPPLATAPNCSTPGRGFDAHRLGELCDMLDHRTHAVSDTYNGDAVLYEVVNATARKAVCLDDTPVAYYVARNLSTRNWIVYMRGGGYCTGAVDCRNRAQTDLGTSTNYACTLPALEVGRSGVEALPQPIHDDATVNPFFYNWNRVYVRYCSGDTFLGRMTKDDGNVFGVSTAGHFGVVGAFEDLMNYHGMDSAQNVVIGGSSAGSIGAITHLDLLNEMINSRTNNNTKVIGIGDGGWFRPFPLESEVTEKGLAFNESSADNSAFIQGIVALFGLVFNAFHDVGCVFERGATARKGQDCISASYTFPHLTTPAIMLTQRWDTYDVWLKLTPRHYVCASVAGSLDNRTRHYLSAYGHRSDELTSTFRSKRTAIFMPNCYKHTSFSIGENTSGVIVSGPPCGSIDGLTPYEAAVNFVKGALRNEGNLDAYSVIDSTPPDKLAISCNSQCGSKQCTWATNFNGSNYNYDTHSCPDNQASSFGAYGIAEGLTTCNSVGYPAKTPAGSPAGQSSHDAFLVIGLVLSSIYFVL